METPNKPGYARNASIYKQGALVHSVVERLQDVQDAINQARYCADGLDEALNWLFAHLDERGPLPDLLRG